MPSAINFVPGYPDQTMTTVFDDFPVTLRAKWNERFGFWSLGIYDRDRNPILTGIKLVQNYPLVGKYNLSQFGGELIFIRMSGTKDRPDFDSLGGDHVLVYLAEEELNAL